MTWRESLAIVNSVAKALGLFVIIKSEVCFMQLLGGDGVASYLGYVFFAVEINSAVNIVFERASL